MPPVHTYRAELPGLRALAVLLVVVYHVWFGRVSGGVDVFLLISAFLLTGSFLRRIESGSALELPAYWSRTFKRVLPPVAVTVLTTGVTIWLVFPFTVRGEYLRQAGASLLHFENWYLAFTAVDYYAANAGQSPFQHFWSLSIQGQVYLVWPLLLLGVALAARRFGWRPRAVVFWTFAAVFVASLTHSVQLTLADQRWAYFDTFARLWEFALGSLLAVVSPLLEQRLAADLRTRVVLGWVGVAGIVSLGAIMDVRGLFPGALALWPTVSACLVILAGCTGHRFGVDRLLVTRPLRWLGGISYGLYLVHWPLLVSVMVLRNAASLTAGEGLLVIAASIVAGWALTGLVDKPLRQWGWANARTARSALVVAAALGVGLAPIPVAQAQLRAQVAAAESDASRNNPGAQALSPDWRSDPVADPNATALPMAIGADWYDLTNRCTGSLRPSDQDVREECRMHPGDPDKVLAIVGNSRIKQLAPALVGPAVDAGWTVVTVFRSGCHYRLPEQPADACDAFSLALTDYLLNSPITAVAMTSTFLLKQDAPAEVMVPGAEAAVAALTASGIDVIGIRDIPRMPDPGGIGYSLTNCELETPGNPECLTDVSAPFQPTSPDHVLRAAVQPGGELTLVEVNQWICPDNICRPTIGNVWVWMDPHHLTATYSATLADPMTRELELAGWHW